MNDTLKKQMDFFERLACLALAVSYVGVSDADHDFLTEHRGQAVSAPTTVTAAPVHTHVRAALFIERGWFAPEEEVEAMVEIARRESSLRPTAQHQKSSAFGMFGFLDQTWQTVGVPKTSDPFAQTVAAVRYVDRRYGSPANALRFHDRKGWY